MNDPSLPQIGPNQKVFQLDNHVRTIKMGMNLTGLVLGKASEGLLDQYIILLDNPLSTHKAIVVPSSCLELISDA